MGNVAVDMADIRKSYGSIVALDEVNLSVRSGEVTALVGDNGAGKSTLIKCLSGVHSPDSGTIRIRGEEAFIDSPGKAKELGIETTYQDLALASNLSVAKNIFLGREEVLGPNRLFGVLNKSKMRAQAQELLEDLNIGDIDPDALAGDLSGGQRQLVAISRTLLTDPEIVIMDEPTSALSVEGATQVLDLIRELREQGITVLLISHNLDHVLDVADRIKVLYQGMDAGVLERDVATRDEIVSRMVSGLPDQQPEDTVA
ncbi:ATP-binding cassette domain-containing protein [Halorhabdus rudnickae]|uniref:ATP-binding cassette domain-containing protein n=1 Tax=Halorhabdus rudnickae TaxID=1775544 RepID=UPI0010824381|nr:ATP-binding cassette domain-containing protein [Halorhabdus rudnickae]